MTGDSETLAYSECDVSLLRRASSLSVPLSLAAVTDTTTSTRDCGAVQSRGCDSRILHRWRVLSSAFWIYCRESPIGQWSLNAFLLIWIYFVVLCCLGSVVFYFLHYTRFYKQLNYLNTECLRFNYLWTFSRQMYFIVVYPMLIGFVIKLTNSTKIKLNNCLNPKLFEMVVSYSVWNTINGTIILTVLMNAVIYKTCYD